MLNMLQRWKEDVAAAVVKEVAAMTDRTIETRNRIIEATWRATVKDDKPQPEDGELIIKKNIRTEEGQEETQYNFIYKGELAVVITEKQNYCDYSYFLTSDKISVSELMQKVAEVERIE
ncbi:hypothetical protein C808_00568 [Lachnospiraceae bacterium M18-1]|nr:hypothetical protein C808_00568 [Lachnospiraceae bacterium M18-1]